MSSGLMFASATTSGNEVGDLDRDRIQDQDQTRDGDCDRDCICDGDGESECNCNGPSDGGDGVRNCYGQTGDNDPKLEMVRSRNNWQYRWQKIQ